MYYLGGALGCNCGARCRGAACRQRLRGRRREPRCASRPRRMRRGERLSSGMRMIPPSARARRRRGAPQPALRAAAACTQQLALTHAPVRGPSFKFRVIAASAHPRRGPARRRRRSMADPGPASAGDAPGGASAAAPQQAPSALPPLRGERAVLPLSFDLSCKHDRTVPFQCQARGPPCPHAAACAAADARRRTRPTHRPWRSRGRDRGPARHGSGRALLCAAVENARRVARGSFLAHKARAALRPARCPAVPVRAPDPPHSSLCAPVSACQPCCGAALRKALRAPRLVAPAGQQGLVSPICDPRMPCREGLAHLWPIRRCAVVL